MKIILFLYLILLSVCSAQYYKADMVFADTVFVIDTSGADSFYFESEYGSIYLKDDGKTSGRCLVISTEIDTAFVIGDGTDGVDYIIKFNGHDSQGVIVWDEDGDKFKFKCGIEMDCVNILDTLKMGVLLIPCVAGTTATGVYGQAVYDTSASPDSLYIWGENGWEYQGN